MHTQSYKRENDTSLPPWLYPASSTCWPAQHGITAQHGLSNTDVTTTSDINDHVDDNEDDDADDNNNKNDDDEDENSNNNDDKQQ